MTTPFIPAAVRRSPYPVGQWGRGGAFFDRLNRFASVVVNVFPRMDGTDLGASGAERSLYDPPLFSLVGSGLVVGRPSGGIDPAIYTPRLKGAVRG